MATETIKTPQILSSDPLVPDAFTPAQVEGHYFANNGGTIVMVTNSSNAAITVTVASQLVVDGLAVADLEVDVDPDETKIIPPLNPTIFNDADGYAHMAFSAVTDVAVSIISLGI